MSCNKIWWGISALNHDASLTVVQGNEILFAAHAERYTRIKNDNYLNSQIIEAARAFGEPDKLVWFERHLSKRARQFRAGDYRAVTSISPRSHLMSLGISSDITLMNVPHHQSHAAAGFYTSPFDDAAILVADAIGEWNCMTVWEGLPNASLNRIHNTNYPDSMGLLYSAMTERVGLKPNEEEYILMGMAAYGKPIYYDEIVKYFVDEMVAPEFRLKLNVHCGIDGWRPDLTTEEDYFNIAASIQKLVEEYIIGLVKWTSTKIKSKNLIFMGGMALNCVANQKIAELGLYDNIWIMPNPGDAGSSLGAILAIQEKKINWRGPYLGTDIDRPFDINEVVSAIIDRKIIGIANGRAEFGPRALGNRSLIADPRGDEIKAKVNEIKHRQQFRPFAPIILEEFAHEYFELPVTTSPYMQFTAKCRRPDLFPAICHIDNTSRVQTLTAEQNPKIHAVLSEFYKRTGCPMLLNTSLNIKGEPLVDNWEDALLFSKEHNVPIF